MIIQLLIRRNNRIKHLDRHSKTRLSLTALAITLHDYLEEMQPPTEGKLRAVTRQVIHSHFRWVNLEWIAMIKNEIIISQGRLRALI